MNYAPEGKPAPVVEKGAFPFAAVALDHGHIYGRCNSGEYHLRCQGQVGFPFFGELILDCLNRTEHAMTQKHAFRAAELCLRAQAQARRVE